MYRNSGRLDRNPDYMYYSDYDYPPRPKQLKRQRRRRR